MGIESINRDTASETVSFQWYPLIPIAFFINPHYVKLTFNVGFLYKMKPPLKLIAFFFPSKAPLTKRTSVYI
jgi:hypothetical protein